MWLSCFDWGVSRTLAHHSWLSELSKLWVGLMLSVFLLPYFSRATLSSITWAVLFHRDLKDDALPQGSCLGGYVTDNFFCRFCAAAFRMAAKVLIQIAVVMPLERAGHQTVQRHHGVGYQWWSRTLKKLILVIEHNIKLWVNIFMHHAKWKDSGCTR